VIKIYFFYGALCTRSKRPVENPDTDSPLVGYSANSFDERTYPRWAWMITIMNVENKMNI
jgi:hypothetical protein